MAFVVLWAIGGTVGFVVLWILTIRFLAYIGVIGTDPSGRLQIGGTPIAVIACGPVPIAMLVFVVLGLKGQLIGTKMVRQNRSLSPSHYWKCPACGYDMSRVKSDLCPECGESLSMMKNRKH